MTLHPIDDPDYLPFKLDLQQRRMLLLRLTHAQRADAAFLDERAMPAEPEGVWCPLTLLPRHELGAPLDFIFHIGHCGSTLLSRVLQAWPQCQVLREPLPLRTLAQADALDAELLRTLLALWSRPQPPAARALIKATSSCNGLIVPILEAAPASRAVLLDMPLNAYLATILKSPGAIDDARAAAPERLQCLVDALEAEIRIESLTVPQSCAMGWLAERVRFARLAAGPYGGRVLRVDFHRLLASPQQTLGDVARHLGLPDDGIGAALRAPVWQQYSKSTAHRYGKQDRDHDLALSLRRFGAAIDDGVRWVEAFAAEHPACAEAMASLELR